MKITSTKISKESWCHLRAIQNTNNFLARMPLSFRGYTNKKISTLCPSAGNFVFRVMMLLFTIALLKILPKVEVMIISTSERRMLHVAVSSMQYAVCSVCLCTMNCERSALFTLYAFTNLANMHKIMISSSLALNPCTAENMSSFHLEEAYAAAVSLNNVGVSLLQHHSFVPAMAAFNDALAIMRDLSRYAVDESGKSLHPRAMSTISAAGEKLRRARQDLASSISSVVGKERAEIDFCILTDNEAATVVIDALKTQSVFTKNTCFLIRIESYEVDELVELDLESSVILQNYGNVYRCLAFLSEPNKARQHSENAFKLFNLAFSLLRGQCEDEIDEDVLPISILILKSLVAFAAILEMNEQEEMFNSHMSDFRDLFLEVEGFLAESKCITAAAA